ncbi:MAG: hypothetical protein ACREJ6_03420 [Candidatus Methylomirabilis sp.]
MVGPAQPDPVDLRGPAGGGGGCGGAGEADVRYERAWRRRIGAEIHAGRLFRHIFERMTGEEMDAVFRVLAADGVLEEVAAEARFDWHRGVILAMLRHPRLSGLLLRRAWLG